MNNEIADKFNDEAREIEARLEELGKMICNIREGGPSWQHVNRAIAEVRNAIATSYHMYES